MAPPLQFSVRFFNLPNNVRLSGFCRVKASYRAAGRRKRDAGDAIQPACGAGMDGAQGKILGCRRECCHNKSIAAYTFGRDRKADRDSVGFCQRSLILCHGWQFNSKQYTAAANLHDSRYLSSVQPVCSCPLQPGIQLVRIRCLRFTSHMYIHPLAYRH